MNKKNCTRRGFSTTPRAETFALDDGNSVSHMAAVKSADAKSEPTAAAPAVIPLPTAVLEQ